jgi:hypothetical protein
VFPLTISPFRWFLLSTYIALHGYQPYMPSHTLCSPCMRSLEAALHNPIGIRPKRKLTCPHTPPQYYVAPLSACSATHHHVPPLASIVTPIDRSALGEFISTKISQKSHVTCYHAPVALSALDPRPYSRTHVTRAHIYRPGSTD